MAKGKAAEIAQVKSDQRYWRKVGKLLGMELYGWTYRHRASFHRDFGYSSKPYEVDGFMAELLLKLSKNQTPIERKKRK